MFGTSLLGGNPKENKYVINFSSKYSKKTPLNGHCRVIGLAMLAL
jgi:hypothetical protein